MTGLETGRQIAKKIEIEEEKKMEEEKFSKKEEGRNPKYKRA